LNCLIASSFSIEVLIRVFFRNNTLVESGPKGAQLQLAFLQTRLAFQRKTKVEMLKKSQIEKLYYQLHFPDRFSTWGHQKHEPCSLQYCHGFRWEWMGSLVFFGVGEKHPV